jgi:DNA-binding LytR/AlgR family response regulator
MDTPKVKVLIVEDETSTAFELSEGLEREGYAIAGIADSAKRAIALFVQEKPCIVLMDTHLRGKWDGVDTALELLRIREVPIVYLSALTDAQTIERVKAIRPAAFLTKPYSLPNVRIAIELALSNLNGLEDKDTIASGKDLILQLEDAIFIKNNLHFIKIGLADILYLEANNNYICLWVQDRKFALRIPLSQALAKINFDKLVRIHRSYAVNIGRVTSFSDAEVWVDKLRLPMGRNYRDAFFKRFIFK